MLFCFACSWIWIFSWPRTRNGNARRLAYRFIYSWVYNRCNLYLYDWCWNKKMDQKSGFYSNDRSIYLLPHRPHRLVNDYARWIDQAYRVVKGQVASLDTWIYNLWHGHRIDRNYAGRWSILEQHDYDPLADIRLSSSGVWSWASDKPALHAAVRDYFCQRREDG